MVPSSRTSAGAAAGSSEQSSTGRSLSFSGSGAVADGDELTHRDEVGLAGQPLEGTGDEGRGRAGRAAVAGLVAAPRAARAGLARADALPAGVGSAVATSVRWRWRDFFPMARTLVAARQRDGSARRGSDQRRAGRARWCGSGCSPPTSGRRASRRSPRPRPARSETPASTTLGGGQGAAVGDGDVDAASLDVHATCMVPSASGRAWRTALPTSSLTHQPGVVAGLVADAEAVASTPRAAGGRRAHSPG